jgi:transcriptional regulator with PAS, ATPase and Fis domain
MHRLDIRCNVDLPVTIISNDRDVTEGKGRFSVLSLSGGFIDSPTFRPSNRMVLLRYELPRHGEFEVIGEVVRHEGNGIATRFCSINRDTKLKLWQYLRENLRLQDNCPYCGQRLEKRVMRCTYCGLSLNVDSPDYLIVHERDTFIRRLDRISRNLEIEDMFKIMNFIDMEILKIGKGHDMFEEFIGSCSAMLDVFSMIRKVAPLDVPVLIKGDKGSGKEFTARAIHERSRRKDKPFISIICSGVPEDVLERELFGGGGRGGNLGYAEGGTVLLKACDKLPLRLQSRIMRLLDGESGSPDVRLLFCTTAEITPLIAKGMFNEGLYRRIKGFVINLPPVRRRGDDRLILARHFLNRFAREIGEHKRLSEEAVEAIKAYDWPGNVKEMINRLRRAVMISKSEVITSDDIGLKIPTKDTVLSIRAIRDEIEKQKLIEALSKFNNNISKAARAMGLSRPTVYKMIRKYGL